MIEGQRLKRILLILLLTAIMVTIVVILLNSAYVKKIGNENPAPGTSCQKCICFGVKGETYLDCATQNCLDRNPIQYTCDGYEYCYATEESCQG